MVSLLPRGDEIGQGLCLARQIIERSGGGSALLISDLQDSGNDVPVLTDELSRYRQSGIGLRDPSAVSERRGPRPLHRPVPASAFVSDTALETDAGTAERQTVVASFPLWLVLLESVLLLPASQRTSTGRSLRWRTP